MELDRQSIEKRDFPIGRRGYDPAAVDAHLRTLAAEVEELRYALESRAGETLGSSAGTQVQGILEAAEATAAEIEQRAAEDARADARGGRRRRRAHARRRGRARAGARAAVARGHSRADRARRVDGRAVRRARGVPAAGASRLARDLSAVETNMAELYDAAAGRGGDAGVAVDLPPAGPPCRTRTPAPTRPCVRGTPSSFPCPRSRFRAPRLRLPPRPRFPRRWPLPRCRLCRPSRRHPHRRDPSPRRVAATATWTERG